MGARTIEGWGIEIRVTRQGVETTFQTADVYADKWRALQAMEWYAVCDSQDGRFIRQERPFEDEIQNVWSDKEKAYTLVSKSIEL